MEATTIWTGLAVVFVATSCVALGLAALAPYLMRLLNVGSGELRAAAWTLRVFSGALVASAMALTVKSVPQVRLRWKTYTVFQTCAGGMTAIAAPVAIYAFGGGLVTAAVVGLSGAVLYLAGLSWHASHLLPQLRRPRLSWQTCRQLVAYGGTLTLGGAAAVPLTSGERFFLSADTSTATVAYYAVAMTIATTLTILPEQLVAPLLPAFSRLESRSAKPEQAALYQRALSVLFMVLTPLLIIAGLLARPVLALWAGASYAAHSTSIMLLLLCGVWFEAFGWLPANLLVLII